MSPMCMIFLRPLLPQLFGKRPGLLPLYRRAVEVTRGFPPERFRDSFNSHQIWGLRWDHRSKSGKIDRLPCCVGWRGGKPTAGLRHGFTPLPTRLTGRTGPKRRGWPGWSARRCAMRCCATTPEGEEAALAAVILRGPEPDRDGCCAWTRGDLCRWMAAHFGKSYHPSSMTRVLRRMGFSRQKARPAHPKRDQKAQDRFEKRGYALP